MTRHDEYDESFESLALLAYQVAFRLTGNRQESEDVAQETLTRAYLHWSRINEYPEAWVVRVATNQVIGTWRRRRARVDDSTGHGPVVDDLVAVRAGLNDALRSLSRRQREVAVLRYLGDMSIETTAAALGCSTSSVKAHSARALEALRRHDALSWDAEPPPPHERRATVSESPPEPEQDSAQEALPVREGANDVPRS